MSNQRRTGSRNSSQNGSGKNISNSNAAPLRSRPSPNQQQSSEKQKSSPGMKVLGTEREVTVDELWELNGPASSRSTPTSSRSQMGNRPGSSGSRQSATPTKQISLQAVKRREDNDEPLEPIDWNDFNRPVSMTEQRIPSPVYSDSGSDMSSPRDANLSAEERLAHVEQRAKDMTSALSSYRMDETEAQVTQKLAEIELSRDEREKKEKQEQDNQYRQLEIDRKSDNIDTKFSNDYYQALSARDTKDNIDMSFIIDNKDKNKTGTSERNNNENIGSQPKDNESVMKKQEVKAGTSSAADLLKIGPHPVSKRENTAHKHAMDKPQATAMGAETKSTSAKRDKKQEATVVDDVSSSDDDSEEEEDLMGEKGKAPNGLLMEFVTCVMQKDYTNAEKLCKMILIYEPENPEALMFTPVIQEKLKQEAEEAEEESEEDSDDSGEEDGDTDDDDDSNSDEEDSDDESSDDEEESDNEDTDGPSHPDSGIASANSD